MFVVPPARCQMYPRSRPIGHIPDTLKTTLRGREVSEGDPLHGESFLLHSGQGGKLLVFCAKTELAVLHQSSYLVCDGTFEMAPNSAYQIYTIHGYTVGGEGLPLLWALLPNKSTETYSELFGCLRTALTDCFGDIGRISYVLTDFELAAINAVKKLFPEATVKGCSFHFRQAIMRRVQLEGMKAVYESEDDFPDVRRWIRHIMAISLLPAFTVPLAWRMLQFPPVTGQQSVDAKTRSLATYVDSTWIAGHFDPQLWTHFDHCGPRTTNLAEGYHNSLNTKFGMPHPSLSSFLDWLQKAQFEVQCRTIQLAAGQPAKPKSAVYARLDASIQEAKLRYSQNIGHVFAYLFPRDDAWQWFHHHTADYLSRVSYLIGA